MAHFGRYKTLIPEKNYSQNDMKKRTQGIFLSRVACSSYCQENMPRKYSEYNPVSVGHLNSERCKIGKLRWMGILSNTEDVCQRCVSYKVPALPTHVMRETCRSVGPWFSQSMVRCRRPRGHGSAIGNSGSILILTPRPAASFLWKRVNTNADGWILLSARVVMFYA